MITDNCRMKIHGSMRQSNAIKVSFRESSLSETHASYRRSYRECAAPHSLCRRSLFHRDGPCTMRATETGGARVDQVKMLRRERGLTQQQLAVAAGVDTSTLNEIE